MELSAEIVEAMLTQTAGMGSESAKDGTRKSLPSEAPVL
jgi:hypothetical protein